MAKNPHIGTSFESFYRSEIDTQSAAPQPSLLYDGDFYAWTRHTAALIRQCHWGAVDTTAVADEIDSLGARVLSDFATSLEAIVSSLLLLGLVVTRCPPVLHTSGRAWRAIVATQRIKVTRLLRDNPSVQQYRAQAVFDAYVIARIAASALLDIEESALPAECPWTVDQVLAEDFWPE